MPMSQNLLCQVIASEVIAKKFLPFLRAIQEEKFCFTTRADFVPFFFTPQLKEDFPTWPVYLLSVWAWVLFSFVWFLRWQVAKLLMAAKTDVSSHSFLVACNMISLTIMLLYASYRHMRHTRHICVIKTHPPTRTHTAKHSLRCSSLPFVWSQLQNAKVTVTGSQSHQGGFACKKIPKV